MKSATGFPPRFLVGVTGFIPPILLAITTQSVWLLLPLNIGILLIGLSLCVFRNGYIEETPIPVRQAVVLRPFSSKGKILIISILCGATLSLITFVLFHWKY